MTTTSWIFFGIGATVLWGGFIISLITFIKNEKRNAGN